MNKGSTNSMIKKRETDKVKKLIYLNKYRVDVKQ